jgi:hypothetical protein
MLLMVQGDEEEKMVKYRWLFLEEENKLGVE